MSWKGGERGRVQEDHPTLPERLFRLNAHSMRQSVSGGREQAPQFEKPLVSVQKLKMVERLSAMEGVRTCRERWNHHLKPGINKEAWTPYEEALIVQVLFSLGPEHSSHLLGFKDTDAILLRQ
eukprot:scaffold195463_cov16-Tisochrysis_lutea.AAC.3